MTPSLYPRSASVLPSIRVAIAAVLASTFHCTAYAVSNESETAATSRQLVETAIRYEHAEGLVRDFAKAHALYCQAARQDSVDAFLRMGWMYANGRGLPRDDAIASTLFRRAAALGSDMGARLGQLIRGEGDKLPACLQTPAVAVAAAEEQAPPPEMPAEAPAVAAVIDYGPTPTVESPAEFRAAPPSIDRRKLVQTVVQMAREFRLDPRLVFAVMQAESNFNPLARSTKNAQGLMQLIPETAERFAVRDAFDPIENLRGGMSYLRWLLSYFRGDVVLTLAGYNAGEGAVDKHRGVPPFAETLAYVQRIRALYPHDRHAFDTRVAAPSWVVNRPTSERPQARQARAERAG